MAAEPPIRDISDTALWAAAYRAEETARPDAVYRDPLAARLAGECGQRALESFPDSSRHSWAWVTRTWLFDQFIAGEVGRGVDLVLSLAAGLDARPYRMDLPATLRWVEVDLPGLVAYKEDVLRQERARCRVERIAQDLADLPARRALFARLGAEARRALVITEGLLIYLSPEEVGALARDLAAIPGFRRWVIDLVSPGLLRMLRRQLGGRLEQAGAPFKFGPAEAQGFFAPHGWRPVEVRSVLRAAAALKRLSPFMRFVSVLPESKGRQGGRPWSAVCLLERQEVARNTR